MSGAGTEGRETWYPTLLLKLLAGAAAFTAMLWPATVLADGIGPPNYHFLNPPTKYLREINQPPQSGSATVMLSDKQAPLLAYTQDSQAGISFLYGGFGFPAGQRAIRIVIRPLRRFTPIPSGELVLDGNVYGFSYVFLPSHRVPARASKQVSLLLSAPHTPVQMIGTISGRWRVLCNIDVLLVTPSGAECNTRLLPSELALIYKPFGLHFRKPSRRTSSIPIVIIAGTAVGVALVVLLLAVLILNLRARSAAQKSI